MIKIYWGVMKTLWKKILLLITFIIAILIVTSIILAKKLTKKETPIKIGIVSTLTGSGSTTGIQVRDAAILAAEEINQRGGINGRMIELIIKDDKFDPEEALRVDHALIDNGVVAIIGHVYSTLAVKTVPLMNKKNILLISPTVKSDELTGLDDNLLKLNIPLDKDAKITAQMAFSRLNLKNVAVVYDMINPKFTESTFNHFKLEFEKLGGIISAAITFNSKENFTAKNIAKKIIKSKAKGIYIITDAIHAALICQHLRINNCNIKIIVSEWALTDLVFVYDGGNSIEKSIGISSFYINSNNEKFLDFKSNYLDRFGQIASTFTAQPSYEAMQILSYALSKTDDPKKLKDIILKQKTFDGLDGKIVFDKYGDCLRNLYILEIQNSKLSAIEKITVEELLENEN